MGRATRWLRSLLGSKKEGKNGAADDTRDKWRQSFKSARDSLDSPSPVPAAKTVVSAAWVPSMDDKTEKEQSKHAIAVAAATAAATDAAITAAQEAVALVQHTNTAPSTEFCGVHEYVAAVTIQRVFRGFLAKKALRALKALVKLQALVRGYLIRKQAAATFHRMQALIRAQAIVRALKSRAFLSPYQGMMDVTRGECANLFHRRSIEKQSSSFDGNPKIVPADPWCRRLLRRTGWSLIESTDEISPSSGSSPRRSLCPQRTPPHDCRPCFNHQEWSSTAQTTPRCIASPTPTKNVCGWGNCPPNYMINTRSFEAKVRSKSAPKQRPGSRQRIPLSEVVVQQARSSLSGVVGMNRTQESFNLKNATVGRLDGSLEVGMEGEEDYHLHMQNW